MLKFSLSKVIFLTVFNFLAEEVLSQDSAISLDNVDKCSDGSPCIDMTLCLRPNDASLEDSEICLLDDFTYGTCCPNVDVGNPPEDPKPEEDPKLEPIPDITDSDVKSAFDNANEQVNEIMAKEAELRRQTSDSGEVDQLATSHQQFFLVENSDAPELSRIGFIESETAKNLGEQLKLTPDQVETAFVQSQPIKDIFSEFCPEEECPECNYRSADGSCNNLKFRSWGQANTAFKRFLKPDYFDGFGEPRGGNPTTLSSPRLLSSQLLPDIIANDQKSTLALMQMGQLIDHDMTLTLIESGSGYSGDGPIKCCNEDRKSEACFDIEIPGDDAFFQSLGGGIDCMEFVRAARANTCPVSSKREQMNQISSYIDCNFIYGSSLEDWKVLRSGEGGRLNTSIVDHREFLPFQDSSCAIKQPTDLKCFRAGDVRANEVSTLTAMQAVFLKEHNRVADTLRQINSDWGDETLFQEARRIVIAELQKFIIFEFLPLIIGWDAMIRYGLIFLGLPYLPFINAGIRSEFSTAAYRLHTLVPNFLERRKYDNSVSDFKKLHDQFNDPSDCYQSGSFEEMIYGLTGQSSQEGENWFADELKNHLFQPKGGNSGLDLPALNIQRGRDFGIRSYNDVREKLCRLKRVSFEDLESGSMVVDDKSAQWIRNFYKTPDDIDLFVGGSFEKPLPGARVGETFACIIGKQFQRTMRGDRFWWTNKDMPSSFTEEQLKEIGKSSLARILCDNSAVLNMQPLALLQPTKGNPKVECCKIRRMDLTKWKDSKTQDC